MPWLSIFNFLLTFFLSKRSGKSTAAAALAGAAVGLGTYYLADPSNPDNLFKIGVDTSQTGSPTAPTVALPTGTVPITDLAGKTIDATGKVLTSWGPTGTAAVIGTAALASSSSLSKYLPWVVGGVALILLTR